MATTTTPPRKPRPSKAAAAINYPLDWLEERSGLVGGVKYFLFRKVPGDVNWMQTLGSATLTAFLGPGRHRGRPRDVLQAVAERGLRLDRAHHERRHARLARPRHAQVGRVGLHHPHVPAHGRVFLFGAYKYPRELNWIVGALLLPIGLFEGFTGYLLPWDQTAYWATVVGININATAPFLGPFIAQFLQGGAEIGPDTLARFYSLHMLVLPGAIIGLILLHLYLVVRLGVSSPPWSKEAAGRSGSRPPRRTAARASRVRRAAER